MPDPLAIGMTLGGLFGGPPALRSKPRIGAREISPLSESSSSRTPHKRRIITEHDLVPFVSGSA